MKTIKKSWLISLSLLFGCLLMSQNANAQLLRGKVINEDTKTPISFASIIFVGPEYANKKIGVSADELGVFILAVKGFPIEIEISSIGFLTKRLSLQRFQSEVIIELEEDFMQLQEFVVSAEKISNEELRSPIQIEKLSLLELQSTPSFNFYDAVSNLKGVDITTQSIIINNVNTRGFNSSTNQRFKQFTDGIDNQAPGLSFSLGNIVGPSSLDIESMELIPGPTTSIYGPGAFNGVLDMRTRNPFDYEGFSFSAKGATISTERDNSKFFNIGNNFLSEVSARYGKQIIKDKLAFKINFTRTEGVDFRANDYRNIGEGRVFETVHSADNQGVNVVNNYGDDRAAFLRLPLIDGNGNFIKDTVLAVTRGGYREEDLVNYNAENIKYNAALHYKISPKTELVLASFYGRASTMITGDDRIALRDFEIGQHKVELTNENFLVRGYMTTQSSGNTFNVGRLADNIVQTAKPDEDWFTQYSNLVTFGRRPFQSARVTADTRFPGPFLPRFEPNTPEFDSLRSVIANSQDPNTGAAIFDESKLYHIEGNMKINKWNDFFESLMVGASARMYDPESNGTIFIDSLTNDVTNFEFGGFVEASKPLDTRTDVSASIRLDKNENFAPKSSQRLSVVRKYKDIHFFRGSVQTGFRFPSVREQFSNQDLGDVRILGGLKEVTDRFDLQNNAITQNSLNEFNRKVMDLVNVEGMNYEIARLENLNILRDGIITNDQLNKIRPEKITSIEFGYRSLIEGKRIIEVSYYRNYYRDFIGVNRVVKPRTSPSTDLLLAAEQVNNPATSDVLFVTANSASKIVTEGLELLYDVTSNGGTNFAINATFANITQDSNDPLTPGFNTPPFKFNVTFGHRKISRNFGAQISWRSRTEFLWQSSFQDGTVAGFSTMDFQMTFKAPGIHSTFRFGGNNVFNRNQFNSFGGPQISAYYYLSFTYDPF